MRNATDESVAAVLYTSRREKDICAYTRVKYIYKEAKEKGFMYVSVNDRYNSSFVNVRISFRWEAAEIDIEPVGRRSLPLSADPLRRDLFFQNMKRRGEGCRTEMDRE